MVFLRGSFREGDRHPAPVEKPRSTLQYKTRGAARLWGALSTNVHNQILALPLGICVPGKINSRPTSTPLSI